MLWHDKQMRTDKIPNFTVMQGVWKVIGQLLMMGSLNQNGFIEPKIRCAMQLLPKKGISELSL